MTDNFYCICLYCIEFIHLFYHDSFVVKMSQTTKAIKWNENEMKNYFIC